MAVGKLKAREVGDIAAARERNKGGEGGFALTVRGDTELSVRFVDEPNEWQEFYQHYMEDAEPRAFPCNDGDCIGCDAGNKPSKKWAARVIDVSEGRVRVFIMTKTVWEKLTGRRCYDKFHTILDRNYTIIRTGTTKNDTDYDVDPDEPSRMNLRKYKAELDELDVVEFLEGQMPTVEVDEKPARRSAKTTTKPSTRRRARDEDEDDTAPWEEERPARRASKRTGGAAKPTTTSTTRRRRPMR